MQMAYDRQPTCVGNDIGKKVINNGALELVGGVHPRVYDICRALLCLHPTPCSTIQFVSLQCPLLLTDVVVGVVGRWPIGVMNSLVLCMKTFSSSNISIDNKSSGNLIFALKNITDFKRFHSQFHHSDPSQQIIRTPNSI